MRVFVYFLVKAWYFSFRHTFQKKGFSKLHIAFPHRDWYTFYSDSKISRFWKTSPKTSKFALSITFWKKHHNLKLSRIAFFRKKMIPTLFVNKIVVCSAKLSRSVHQNIKLPSNYFQPFWTWVEASWNQKLFARVPLEYSFLWVKIHKTNTLVVPATGYHHLYPGWWATKFRNWYICVWTWLTSRSSKFLILPCWKLWFDYWQ